MQMTKHVIKGAAGSEPVIEWSMEVDEDGDVRIRANNQMVMFVNSDTGNFTRTTHGAIEGLSQNKEGKVIKSL